MGGADWAVDEAFALPPGGAAFLAELADEIDDSYVASVLLFGSVVTGEVSEGMSDVDLLVVLNDRAPPGYADRLRAAGARLASRHLREEGTEPNPLERYVNRSTGMFQSGFVTTEDAVRSGDFAAIFNTSRLAYLLAPWRTVMYNVFRSAATVTGDRVEPDWSAVGAPLEHQLGELTRSWLTTFSLALVQIPYRVVSDRATLYSLESFKWTAYTCAFHLRGGPVDTLEESLSVVPAGRWYLDRFRRAREDGSADVALLLATPLVVTHVHLRTLVGARRRSGDALREA